MEARVVHISPCEQPFTLACAAATCQLGRHMRPMTQRASGSCCIFVLAILNCAGFVHCVQSHFCGAMF